MQIYLYICWLPAIALETCLDVIPDTRKDNGITLVTRPSSQLFHFVLSTHCCKHCLFQ